MAPSPPAQAVRSFVCLILAGSLLCPLRASSAAPLARELLLFEEPVVSAASKHPQSSRDAPSAVTVITREELHRFGYRTLAEVLRSVRGFYGSYDRNYSYVGVRGFLRPTDYNDRILLLVNGHTYNDDIFQTALLGPEFGIDLEAVERIEIVRGPGSALYGGNALLAVINVVTSTGEEQPGVHPLVETGSFGRKRGQLSGGHVFQNGLDVFASGSVLDVDGPGELFYPAYANPRTNNGIARDADGERLVNFFTRTQYQNFTLQGGTNWREKHVPTGAFGTTFNDAGTKTVDGRRFGDLLYSAEPFAKTTFTARLFYDGVQYHGTYVYGAGPTRTKNEDLADSDWVGSEVRARREMFRGNSLTVGSEYSYHPSASQENFNLPNGASFLDDTRSFSAWGVYAQDEWTLLPSLTLVAGLRFDRYYSRIQEVSPRLAGIWSPLEKTTVKLLYGKAFRPPNLYELYYQAGGAGVPSLPNPRLDPERITTYEAVLEQRLWRGAQGIVALYHYDITGLIDETLVGSPPVLQYRNRSSVQANGAEFELRTPLPRGTSLHTTYSLQDVRSDGRRLSNSPMNLGGLGLLFPLPFGFEGGAELLVVGPRRTLAGRRLEAVPLANLTLNYRTPIRNLDLSAGLYNLFDHSYPDPAGAEHTQDRIPQDGLTFRLQLRYAF